MMAETIKNDFAKRKIIQILGEQGYATYARLLNLFDVYLTDDPEVVAYMIPGKAKIVVNKGLDSDQVSMVVRHEILHEFLTHKQREDKFHNDHPDLMRDHQASNIAGDFEISNRGYTDADKKTAKNLKLNDKTIQGLVTELDEPGWENKSFEEMYELLLQRMEQTKQKFKNFLDSLEKQNQKIQAELDEMEGDSDSNNNSDEDENSETQSNKNGSSKGENGADQSNEGGSSKVNSNNKKSEEEKKLDDAKAKIQKQIDKAQNDLNKNGSEIFGDNKKEELNDIQKRVAKIKEFFDDVKNRESILDDSQKAKQKEKIAKAAKSSERRNADPLNQFKLNLNRFIADQLQETEDETYARINPAYEDSEFILPGRMVKDNKYIPIINVYHDVSGSFDDPAKTEMALRAIDTLNKYVQNGDLEINLYYFANRVSSTKNGVGGGTNGQPILNHIEQTKPTNVIVITDSDINDCSSTVKVLGAVWMLFYNGRSENLIDHLRGKKQTKYYDIS